MRMPMHKVNAVIVCKSVTKGRRRLRRKVTQPETHTAHAIAADTHEARRHEPYPHMTSKTHTAMAGTRVPSAGRSGTGCATAVNSPPKGVNSKPQTHTHAATHPPRTAHPARQPHPGRAGGETSVRTQQQPQ